MWGAPDLFGRQYPYPYNNYINSYIVYTRPQYNAPNNQIYNKPRAQPQHWARSPVVFANVIIVT